MSIYKYGSSSKAVTQPSGRTEFEILKASHKFLRDDEDNPSNNLSWNEQLAKKYYDNLYREFAVCDLKHYKSGNFALRWRTESEVISGAGEMTCGNTRCQLHEQHEIDVAHPSLKTIELPFSYVEGGERKFALVKVVLCDRCLKKLMWKRNKEKEKERERLGERDTKKEETESGGAEQAQSRREHGKGKTVGREEGQREGMGIKLEEEDQGTSLQDAPGSSGATQGPPRRARKRRRDERGSDEPRAYDSAEAEQHHGRRKDSRSRSPRRYDRHHTRHR
ncbi:hypothetical protein WOLCODRAFT_72611 [Wolfiporia cocos MD-104 SS10]|uniref:Protein FRA10AC1 n=1 Tax=Wolfiporia cocos (strain MD-104) TaxID=742152 RepID=A0A2H3K0U8_WOLCO|nr:hypothetical protein WOLCODRAFT_72611 [Wolfiporia cocos MD-104 SS10]